MPLYSYGVLVGRAVDSRREGGTDSPHYQVRIDAAGTSYRIAVNVHSQQSPSELLYLADDDFPHPVTARSPASAPGWTRCPRARRGDLDFIRGNLFDRAAMRPLPPDASGPDNDLADLLDHHVQRAIADPRRARLRVRRALGAREPATKDKVFGFKPGNGVHDIHMNQGNSRPLPRRRRRVAGRRAAAPLPAERPLGRRSSSPSRARPGTPTTSPATPSRTPAEPEPDDRRSRSASSPPMVNPIGAAPERETVTLLNASPSAVDLTGWTSPTA